LREGLGVGSRLLISGVVSCEREPTPYPLPQAGGGE
jgi:hypothetical protein